MNGNVYSKDSFHEMEFQVRWVNWNFYTSEQDRLVGMEENSATVYWVKERGSQQNPVGVWYVANLLLANYYSRAMHFVPQETIAVPNLVEYWYEDVWTILVVWMCFGACMKIIMSLICLEIEKEH